MKRLLVLSGLALLAPGCTPERLVFLQNPSTGETVTCSSDYGRSTYLVTQFTGDMSASEACAAAYQKAGFLRLN